MKPFPFLSFLFSFALLLACKPESGQVQEEPTQNTSPQETPNAATEQAPTASTPAAAVSGGHDYTFLTDKILIYKAGFGGVKGQQLYKDEWIDLASDGTFKAGKLKQQTHTGRWGYNHDVKVIQLIPDNADFPRSEWKVMHNEQMMVWVGTQTFGNNNTQVQLVRSETLPE